jgi:hypothetical protein
MSDPKDEAWSNYYALKSRVASMAGFSLIALIPAEFRWWILAAAAFAYVVTVACEPKVRRLRVALVCLAPLPASWLIAWLVPDGFLRVLLVLGCLIVGLFALYVPEVDLDESRTP